MKLRDWQEKRLVALKTASFHVSKHFEDVTLVIYTFPPKEREDEMFKLIKCSILHSWEVLGQLRTTIVADRPFDAVNDFAAQHPNVVDLQIAPNIIPSNIKTMSLDCIKNLHTRFHTPYCLIIQDDGMPIKDNLAVFLGKYDFIGAPIISDGWKRKLAYAVGLGSFNGGFSLRSKRFCEYASKMWFSFFSKFMPEDHRHLGEDFYYTTLLKFLPMTWWKFKFPNEKEAFRFAVDALNGHVKVPNDIKSFGFHGKDTAELLLGKDYSVRHIHSKTRDKHSPRLSIIVPCYRSEAYLQNILNDVLRQTFQDWELIVIGNGPLQEQQREITNEIAVRDHRVTYISIEEAGVSRARNYGINLAKGEWISFVDVDDRLSADWAENCLVHVERKPDVVVGGVCYRNLVKGTFSAEDLDVPEKGLYSEIPKNFLKLFLSNEATTYSTWTKIYNAKFLKSSNVRFNEDISIYEDAIFNLELALKCKSMFFVRQMGYEYCNHGKLSALRRCHKSLPVAVRLRRHLLEEALCASGENVDAVSMRINNEIIGESLDIILNEFRHGSISSFREKVQLARKLLDSSELKSAVRGISYFPINISHFMFRGFFLIDSALVCILVLATLFWIRNGNR